VPQWFSSLTNGAEHGGTGLETKHNSSHETIFLKQWLGLDSVSGILRNLFDLGFNSDQAQ
jgi:hypothetical protein